MNSGLQQGANKISKLGELHAYQTHIAQKIADAQASSLTGASKLAVRVGLYNIYIPTEEMRALLVMPPLTLIPLAKQWLKGLVVVRAEVLTVINLNYCLSAYINEQLQGYQKILNDYDNRIKSKDIDIDKDKDKDIDIKSTKTNDVNIKIHKKKWVNQPEYATHSSNAKLLVLSATSHNQLSIAVDQVYGIISQSALADHTIHPFSAALDGTIFKQITVNAHDTVFIDFSVSNFIKSEYFLKLTY
jgi:chemotaxis signal transduction protein